MNKTGNKKKRIIFVCNVDWFFYSHRINLAHRCLEDGWEVHLLCRVTTLRKKLESMGMRVSHVPFARNGLPLLNMFYCYIRLLFTFISVRPSVVHLITPLCNIIGGLAARTIPLSHLIVAISGFGSSFQGDTMRQRVRSCVIKKIYSAVFRNQKISVITQTEHDSSVVLSFKALPSSSVFIIPGSGVNLKEFVPPDALPQSNIILLACRLLISKGVTHFLEVAESFARNPSQNLNPQFVLAGKFDYENKDCVSHSLVKDLHEQGVIQYLGEVQDMAELLRNTSIFFYPSLYGEGLPKILCEAAACGVPVITTDHPGCRDAIRSKVTGVLLKSINIKESRVAIETMLQCKDSLRTYSTAARQLAEERFDICHVTEQHMKIYQSKLN